MNKQAHLLILLFLFIVPILRAADPEPKTPREMRAVWVATVANIDWPSKPGLSVFELKKETTAILDKAVSLNLNAIVLQVRPQADAIYKSDIEPWSYYVTGQQGKAPDSLFDPLQYWITEAHARGLELHAWFNPYRANHPANRAGISEKSIIKTKPNLVKKLEAEGYYWLNPTLKEVQDYSYSVVMDVVKRYDVDAVHFDDYFYPYAEYNNNKDFPDEDTYAEYKKSGGKLERGDWRRNAVNVFMERVYKGVKKFKKTVKVGISPFGYYRPGSPEGIGGTFDQYAALYADAKLWWNKGWCDYFVPQLYWPISRVNLSYPVILNWWKEENKMQRHLWPGIILSGDRPITDIALETVNQVMTTRGILPSSPGVMYFSMQPMMVHDTTIDRMLLAGPYRNKALVPSFTWLDNKAPSAPTVTLENNAGKLNIAWKPAGKEEAFVYVVYCKSGSRWSSDILPAGTTSLSKDISKIKISEVVVTAVDRCGNESRKIVKQVK